LGFFQSTSGPGVCALIVACYPKIEIELQRVHRVIDLLAERDAIELVEQGLVEPLADAVGLRALHLSSSVMDVLNGEVELILVPVMSVPRRV
jgi:hypothetical protein